MTTKTLRIEHWFLYQNRIGGKVYGHPRQPDGAEHMSSLELTGVDFTTGTASTKNTTYNLGVPYGAGFTLDDLPYLANTAGAESGQPLPSDNGGGDDGSGAGELGDGGPSPEDAASASAGGEPGSEGEGEEQQSGGGAESAASDAGEGDEELRHAGDEDGEADQQDKVAETDSGKDGVAA